MRACSQAFWVVLACLLISPVIASAQDWKNPADRYLSAHEAYDDAACPIAQDNIQHFVYFARDRRAMRGHALLGSDRFEGAHTPF